MTNFHSYNLDENLVFAFVGDHDLSTIPGAEPKILAATNGQPRVVFDLSAATYADSSMLNLLVQKWKVLGDRMRVVVPANCAIRRLFSISGLDSYFAISETVSDAVARAHQDALTHRSA